MASLKWVFTDDAPIELATRGVAVVSTDWNQSASARGQPPPPTTVSVSSPVKSG